MESRCKVCKLKIKDPEFYEELSKFFSGEQKDSLRDLQKKARTKGKNISYSSFRRHMKKHLGE